MLKALINNDRLVEAGDNILSIISTEANSELSHCLEHLEAAILQPESLQKDRALRALRNIG